MDEKKMDGDETARAQAAREVDAWLEAAEHATGWPMAQDPSAIGALALRFVLKAPPGEDGLIEGEYEAQILACARLRQLAGVFCQDQGALSLGREVGACQGDVVDFEQCLRDEELLGEKRAAGAPNRSLFIASICRNSANYMQAGLGELVSLDPLRGEASAMLVARLSFDPIESDAFPQAAAMAMERLRQALGPACFFHVAGGAKYWSKGALAQKMLGWPSSVQAWESLAWAQSESEALDAHAKAGAARTKKIL